MSNSDPFSDLDEKMGEAMETEPEDEESAESTQTAESADSEKPPETIDEPSTTEESAESDAEEEHDPLAEPAFPAGNDLNRSLYVRDDTWTSFDDAIDIDLRPRLKRSGVSDIQKRELHDAALQVAIDNPEAVVEAFLDARGISELEEG